VEAERAARVALQSRMRIPNFPGLTECHGARQRLLVTRPLNALSHCGRRWDVTRKVIESASSAGRAPIGSNKIESNY
jgi:hypothetical protein